MTSNTRFPHRRDEKGATFVEAALVTPLVLLLIFGLIQGALYFRSHLTATYAAQVGARAGAVASGSSAADYDILRAIDKTTAALAQGSIERIVVYKAGAPNGSPPADCLTAPIGTGVAGVCNIYSPADLDRPAGDFGTGPALDGWAGDDAWGALSREQRRSVGTDYLGVYVKTLCKCGNIAFDAPTAVTRKSVVRLEASQS